jgi:hypothetical protein
LKDAPEFAENSQHGIPLTFKEKRTTSRKRMFDYENGDEPTANPENRFIIEYFNVLVNEIKSNLQTQLEPFSEFVDKSGLVFEVSSLKKCRKLLKYCQDLKTFLSVGDDCDFDGNELSKNCNCN